MVGGDGGGNDCIAGQLQKITLQAGESCPLFPSSYPASRDTIPCYRPSWKYSSPIAVLQRICTSPFS